MDCFEKGSSDGVTEYTGLQLKQLVGFGKDGYKNFDGIITDLQMQIYLSIKEFRCKRNKKGQVPYGEIEERAETRKHPITFDEDSPELTPEMEKAFRWKQKNRNRLIIIIR